MCVISLLIFTLIFNLYTCVCPNRDLFDPATSKCYIICNEKTDWFSAKESCEVKGGYLAKIESRKDMSFIKSKASKGYYWFGMNDQETENDFRWLDGTSVTWFDWKSNQPNGDITQNCTTIDNNWQWQDKECPNLYGYVCNLHSGLSQFGAKKLTNDLQDAKDLGRESAEGREDCSLRCLAKSQCAFWSYSKTSSSNNCKFYYIKSGSTVSLESSRDYYKMEWIKKENATST